MSGPDVADAARREQIGRFAAAYVHALGLVGDLADESRSEIEQMLAARRPIDDAALVTRAGEISRLLELEVQGDASVRARIDQQFAAAYSDEQVSNAQLDTLGRLVHDTRSE